MSAIGQSITIVGSLACAAYLGEGEFWGMIGMITLGFLVGVFGSYVNPDSGESSDEADEE